MDTQNILENSDNISLEAVTTLDQRPRFCDIWPNAKTGLEMLRDLVKNPVVKVVIGTVIAAGDAIAGKIC